MTDTSAPRWRVAYRSKPDGVQVGEAKSLIVQAESMVTALKDAQTKMVEMDGGPFAIISIEPDPQPTEDPVTAADAPMARALLDDMLGRQ